MTPFEIMALQCCETSHHYWVMPVYVRRGLVVTKLTKNGLKSCFPQYPGSMLYATKIEDRHLKEPLLTEMAVFYMQIGFMLTTVTFDSYDGHRKKKQCWQSVDLPALELIFS